MPEPTPGPWITVETRGPCPPDQQGDLGILGEGDIIAEVYQRIGQYEYAPVAANAALIAAAPDLLSACEAALAYAEADPPADGASDEAWRAWSDLENALRMAIATATGKEAR